MNKPTPAPDLKQPRIIACEPGVWEVRRGDRLCARLTCVAVDDEAGISLDVQPAPDADYAQAIAFGADPRATGKDRLAFDPRRPNGQLRKGATPFFCVEVTQGAHKLPE